MKLFHIAGKVCPNPAFAAEPPCLSNRQAESIKTRRKSVEKLYGGLRDVWFVVVPTTCWVIALLSIAAANLRMRGRIRLRSRTHVKDLMCDVSGWMCCFPA